MITLGELLFSKLHIDYWWHYWVSMFYPRILREPQIFRLVDGRSYQLRHTATPSLGLEIKPLTLQLVDSRLSFFSFF